MALATALAGLGCGQASPPPPEFVVSMLDNAFTPPLLRIPAGAEVTFVNDGRNPHNAVADDASWSTERDFGNLVMPAGTQARVRFAEAGVFPYYCTFHGAPGGVGMAATVVVGDVDYHAATTGGAAPVSRASGVTRRVPQDYPTLQAGVDAAAPGDLVLVDRGVYREEVTVTTPSLVIRGVDRNEVVLDGQFMRGNGILVLADGVSIENMTARNAVLNGFFWIGVTGYRAAYLTAINNGDYGIYAFDSTDGLIEHSYASGSPDSGFYIGQCYPCRAILRFVTAEHNALGYSGTNSGGDLYLVSSVWRHNQMGIVPNTLDTELLPPERETTIVANWVFDNNDRNAPIRSAMSAGFGNGIFLPGGNRNRVERNVVVGHSRHGILITPSYSEQFWRADGNVVRGNTVRRSGRADLAVAGIGSSGNCFEANDFETASPPGIERLEACDGPRLPIARDLSSTIGLAVRAWRASRGDYAHGEVADQPAPPPQPQLPGGADAPVQPAVNVFERANLDLEHTPLPEAASRYLESAAPDAPLPSGARVTPPGLARRIFDLWSAYLPFALYLLWSGLALGDLQRRRDLGGALRSAWRMAVVLLPVAGAVAYHVAGGSELSRAVRAWALAGGAALYAALVIGAGILGAIA